MKARIYRPARNAMQSGKGNNKSWMLTFEPETPRSVEPLMGYTSSSDMDQQIQLTFETREAAEAYARREGIPYTVLPDHRPVPKRVSYPDNFKNDRKSPWTH